MAKLRVKEIAESKGINQKRLIELSGMTDQLIYRYWHNYTKSVSLDQIERIADALNVEPGDLIAREVNTSN